MSIPNNPNPNQVVNAVKDLESSKLSKSLGSDFSNKILITDSDGDVAVTDSLDIVVDVSSYDVGTSITDSTIIAKLKEENVIVKNNSTQYRLATIMSGNTYVYTVMDSVTGASYIVLVEMNGGMYVYQKGTTSWVTPDTVLTKTNETEFTPSADYQPSTKKYVDDIVPTAMTTAEINTIFEAEYVPDPTILTTNANATVEDETLVFPES